MCTLLLTKEARIYNGAKTASSINGAGKSGQLHVRVKLEYFLMPYTKINSKWIKDLNVRPESIKLLEKNISRTLDDINQSKILYDLPPRVMEIKTKVNQWVMRNAGLKEAQAGIKIAGRNICSGLFPTFLLGCLFFCIESYELFVYFENESFVSCFICYYFLPF